MTKVTALEISVLVNIVALGSASVSVQQIASGPYEVKATQVNAVLLNLKGKGLVTRDGDTVSLTEAGVAVHSELFPVQKDLETLRRESNAELNRPAKPSSAHELKLINDLIELRTQARRLADSVTVFEESLKPQSLSAHLQKMFPDVDFVNVKLYNTDPLNLLGFPVLA